MLSFKIRMFDTIGIFILKILFTYSDDNNQFKSIDLKISLDLLNFSKHRSTTYMYNSIYRLYIKFCSNIIHE